ncbi:MAG: THUMP domain-containing protein [Candidatus Ranarchaeia archaeon]
MYLLVSTPRNLEKPALKELKSILSKIEGVKFERLRMSISGLLLLKINKDVFEIIKIIREMVVDDPWGFNVIQKIKPIETLIQTRLDLIGVEIEEFVPRIPEGESFRILLKRRQTNLEPTVIISELAQRFDRPVDLENPDHIILVEVLGNKTGLAVCKKDDIISLSLIRDGN